MLLKKIFGGVLLSFIVVLCCGCSLFQIKLIPKNQNIATDDPVPPAIIEDSTVTNCSVYGEILKDSFKSFNGKTSYSLHMYQQNYSSVQGSGQMKSASVIKLFIMEYAYSLMAEGAITPETTINGRPLSSLIESMITVSDNTATNILIDHFTMTELNSYFADCGYTDTVLSRRMLDTAAASQGLENYTSAKDVMAFLDKLYYNKEIYPYNDMLAVMKRQQIATKLRRDMPSDIEIASKTGELSDTENDVAIVFTPKGDFAIVCLTGGGSSSEAKNAMATACRKIYDTLQNL